jgi:hypothetical protein
MDYRWFGMTPRLRSERRELLALGSRRSFVAFDVVGLLHSVVDLSECILRSKEFVLLEELPTTLANPIELVPQSVLPAAL